MPFLWDDSLPWRKPLRFLAWRLWDWLWLHGGRGWGACVLRRQMFPHLFLTFNKTPPLLNRFCLLKNWGTVALQCCISSAVQQNEQAIRVSVYVYIYTLPFGHPLLPSGYSPPPSHPCRSSQSSKLSSLCSASGSH